MPSGARCKPCLESRLKKLTHHFDYDWLFRSEEFDAAVDKMAGAGGSEIDDAGLALLRQRVRATREHLNVQNGSSNGNSNGTRNSKTVRTVVDKGLGGCGGNPYVATASGTFAHCAEECTRNPNCVKFQREKSSGNCYLSGKDSTTQSLEPSGFAAWECGFVQLMEPSAGSRSEAPS